MLIYINDIIIYSQSINQHIIYFDQVLKIFESSEIILILSKCYFIYFNIKMFKYYIFRLRLNIIKKKIKII